MLEIQLVAEDQRKASVLQIEGLLHGLEYAAATDSDLTEELLVMFVRILFANSGCCAEHDTFASDHPLGYAGLPLFLAAGLAAQYAELSFGAWSAPHLFLSYGVIIPSFWLALNGVRQRSWRNPNVGRLLHDWQVVFVS